MKFDIKGDIDNHQYGIVLPLFVEAFDDSFHKSGYGEFKEYLINSGCKKWIIFSDYVLDGEKNYVITFSIIPHIFDFELFKKMVHKIAPNDIKNTKNVHSEFLKLLKNDQIIHISIVLDKEMRICPNDEKQFLLNKTKLLIKYLYQCQTNSESKESCNQQIRHLKVLQKELTKKSPNLKIIRNIEIIALLVSYIIHSMSEIVKIETIGWFSDRDSILSYRQKDVQHPIIFDLISNYVLALSEVNDATCIPPLVFGVPESTGTMWYDEFNRIPDYISATIADYDIQKNEVSNTKFLHMIEKVMASNENIKIYNLKSFKNVYSASRIIINAS